MVLKPAEQERINHLRKNFSPICRAVEEKLPQDPRLDTKEETAVRMIVQMIRDAFTDVVVMRAIELLVKVWGVIQVDRDRDQAKKKIEKVAEDAHRMAKQFQQTLKENADGNGSK